MSNASPGDGAEYLQWAALAITACGIVLQHFWSRHSLTTHRQQDQFDKHIGDPAKELISKIDAFSALVPLIRTGQEPEDTQKMAHALLVRSVNTFIRDCVNSPVSGGNDWYRVSTRELEDGMPSDPDQAVTVLQARSLTSSLERLKRSIQELVSNQRP